MKTSDEIRKIHDKVNLLCAKGINHPNSMEGDVYTALLNVRSDLLHLQHKIRRY